MAALREALKDPTKARERALMLRERLLAERTEEAFAEHVTKLLLKPEPDRESDR